MKKFASLCLLSISNTVFAIEGTAYSSTEGLLNSVWATYGQGVVPIDTTNYTLSGDFALLVDRGIQWNTGSKPPPIGQSVGTPSGNYLRNIIVQSVGGQKHSLTLTNSGPRRRLSAEKLTITNSKLVLRDDVIFDFESPTNSETVELNNSDLIFDWTTGEPSFYAKGGNTLAFEVSGTSLIQGFTQGTTAGYAVHGDQNNFDGINIAANSRLTLLDWNTELNSFGRDGAFTINAASGSTLYIQRLDAGTTGLIQAASNRKFVDFQINLTDADFVLDNSPLDPDAINAANSTLSFESGSSFLNSTGINLEDSSVAIADGADLANASVRFNVGSNQLHSAILGATAIGEMSFNGGAANVTADDSTGFTGLASFGAVPGAEVTIGENGDMSNTPIGLRANSFMILDDSLINGHIDFDLDSSTGILFRNTPKFSPGVGAGDIGEIRFNLNGANANNTAIPNFGDPSLQFNIEVGDTSNDNDKIIFTGGAFAGTHDVVIAPKSSSYTADDLDGNTYVVVEVDAGQDSSTYTVGSTATMPAAIKASGVKATGAMDTYTVTLTKDLNNITTHSALTTRNQQVAAQSLVNQAPTNTAVNNQLNTVTNAKVAQLANDSHAEPVASHLTVGLEQAEMIINSVFMRNVEFGLSERQESFAPNFLGGDSVSNQNIWADVSRVDGSIDASSNEAGFQYDMTQMTLGANLLSTRDSYAGVYFSVVDQTMDEHDAQSINFDTSGYHLGAYWSGRFNNDVELDGVIGYGTNETDSVRTLTSTPSTSKAEATFDSDFVYVALQVAKPVYNSELVNIAPFGSVSYVSANQDAYTETGLTNPMSVAKSDASSSLIGLGLAFEKDLDDHKGLSANGILRYDRDLSADNSGDHSVDVTSGATGTYTGQNRGANTWTIGAALRYHFAEQHAIGGGATFSKFDNGDEHGLGVSYSYQF